jgi:membrane protease YdiL (CAAX protease family)
MSQSRKKILVFLVLTFLFSAFFYVLIARAGSIQSYALGLMWCPGLAAMLTNLAFQRNLRGMGWKPGPAKYLLAGYALPLLYTLVVYSIVWLSGLGKLSIQEFAQEAAARYGVASQSPFGFALIYFLVMATLGFVSSCLSAFGEEIGWRGLLVPELSRETTFTGAALISGAIWALWHYPAIILGDYRTPGLPLWFALVCFTVLVIGISFAFAWLRLKSGSLWPAVFLHASHNLFIQGIFTPLTQNTGFTPYVIDEFGIGLALAALGLAFWFWRRRAAPGAAQPLQA